ncbi:hypothetical protein K490DRAFT_32116 [Saccharata proteae CBS 121410]|uniref:Late endosomal/lysosomal adaptor and MAPK and MTOR activator domain-containing protein n=1 Tax=Saccharata proteae CBS 121410 TaxID=1314787 RepID=A0A9P4I564_9PEZI|nr:hypothetical protein K490DRAFT_32116 [Saccharata proteae CBS 121410]
MGVCASCLGLGRRASQSEPSDTSQLLSDPYQPQYGSVHAVGQPNGSQLDPEEIRRQRDALERICAQTSEYLIDVSHSAKPDKMSVMFADYSRLFMERFPPNPYPDSRPSSSSTMAEQDEAAWLADVIGSDGDEGHWDQVKPVDFGALTIHFEEMMGSERRPSPVRA